MTAVTCFGMTANPDELRKLAGAVENAEEGWRVRVDALPRYVLTPETLASEPGVIAEHLRMIAGFLERRRDGVPFGGHEFAAELAAKAAAARERDRDRLYTFAGRRRRI